MKYIIDKGNKAPAYLQLYEQLKADIVSGVFGYAVRLPSKRILAEETGISVVPVEHALRLLSDEGYIEARQRSGYFVSYRQKDFTNALQREISVRIAHNHIHPSKSEFPFSVFAKTVRKVLLDYGDELLVKSDNCGTVELKSAIADYLARSNGMSVEPEQIIIGAGAEYLYSLIVQLLGENRVFALENPSYEKIKQVYEANSAVCELLNLGSNGIKSSELEASSASVLHITPFNSFPSGISADASKRYEYISWAKERGGFIIEDNFESELTVSKKNEDTVFSLDKDGRVLYLNTFSKTIAPSMRVGYLVLPKALLKDFNEKLGFYSCTVPVLEQYVLAELILSGNFERHINRVRRNRRKSAEN